MYNHNKAQQIKNRVHISWDILYIRHPQRKNDQETTWYSVIIMARGRLDVLIILSSCSMFVGILKGFLPHMSQLSFVMFTHDGL